MSLKPSKFYQLSCYTLSTAAFSIAEVQSVNSMTVNEEFSQRSQESLSAFSQSFSQTLVQQENVAIAATAFPETIWVPEMIWAPATISAPEAIAPETLAPETLAPGTLAPETLSEPVVSVPQPLDRPEADLNPERPASERPGPVSQQSERQPQPEAFPVAEMPQLEVRVDRPRIEVGTAAMPSVTEPPARVGLPQDALLPSSFENPIVLGQAMDPAIQTATPISDTMPDPVWSRQVADLPSYQAAYSRNMNAWAVQVQACMMQNPKLYVMRSDKVKLPIYFDSKEGTVIQNSSGAAICPVSV